MLELTLRLIASLAVVVGLLLLLIKLGGHRLKGRAGSLVQVVHRQALSRGSAVAVVTVGSRVLLLGTTEQHVTLLTELDPDELADDATLAAVHEDEARPTTPVDASGSPLVGSVLSAQTWRQALAVARGKAS